MMRILGITLMWAMLTSVSYHSKGPSKQAEQSGVREYRFMSIPPPPSCEHLYNVGKSVEWQNCMGVGPK